MGVRVKYNNLPAVIAAIPREGAAGVKSFAEQFQRELDSTLWRDQGQLVSTIREIEPGTMSTTVAVGHWAGKAFYAGFLEWGTSKMSARPMVGPAAHANEPVYAATMASFIRAACGAT